MVERSVELDLKVEELDRQANMAIEARHATEKRYQEWRQEILSQCCGNSPEEIESLTGKANNLQDLRDRNLQASRLELDIVLGRYKDVK